MSTTKPTGQRRKANPADTHSRSRKVTAEFGVKPNYLTWKAYHYLAKHDPDKLRALCSRRPAALEVTK